MSEAVQWVIAGLVVLGAVWFLVIRLGGWRSGDRHQAQGCGCSNCASCPLEADHAESCEEAEQR